MKKIFTFLFISLLAMNLSSQVQYEILFDFEDGIDTTYWMSFANGAEAARTDINVVENPLSDNVNSTDSVLMMDINIDADAWVGFYTDFDDLYLEYNYPIDQIYFTEESHMMAMMVNKPVISASRIKIERSTTGASPSTLTVADTNTVTEEWEFLEYDFSEMIGQGWARLTIFPESTPKAERTQEVVVYVDNIGLQTSGNTSVQEFDGAEMKLYPNPVDFRMAVQYPGMTGIRITGINGQAIRTINFGQTNSKVIEVGDLNTGTYFVTALTSKGKYTMPFVKK